MIKYKKVRKISFEDFKKLYKEYALSKIRENLWFALYTVDGICDTRYCYYVDIIYVFDIIDHDENDDKTIHDIFDAYYDDVYKEKIRDEYDFYCEWVDDMNESIESEYVSERGR